MSNNRGEDYSKVYEKENILDILKKAKKAISNDNTFILKELSNKTIHNASYYQDTDSITIAILIYALGKIIERSKYSSYKDWPIFEKSMLYNLDKAIEDLSEDKIDKFRLDLNEIRLAVNKLSSNLKEYIEDVFRKASINKASRIYEHGISMEQTASLLGITLFELAEYAGKTGISDVNLGVTIPIQKRIKTAEDFLK